MNTLFFLYLVFRMMLAYVTAVWVYAGGLKKRKHFILRLVGWAAVILVFSFLYRGIQPMPYQSEGLSFNYQQGVGVMVHQLAVILMIVLAIWSCFSCDFYKALALGASASATRKIYLDIVSILECVGLQRNKIGEVWHGVYSLTVMAAVYVCAYLVFHKRVSALFESRFMWKNTILSIIILLAVSAFSSIATNAAGLTEQISIYIYGYDMAILLVCLFMLFALFLNENLQTEKQFILQSLQMKNDYYKITKENIEMINIKCHDMRHQLRHLNPEGQQAESYKKQVEEIINVYDNILKTGNEALDVVLTDKSLYCQKNRIRILCVADGKALAFMEDMDIYSLFGNLLDNAIESVSKISDEEKKIIHVNLRRKGDMVFIEVANYFAEKPRFEGQFPVTTKSDQAYHGFGLRSVSLIAKKYHGTLNLEQKDGLFTARVLLSAQE